MKVRRPVFIIGCPRSGTTLLFRILSESKELWSSYRESHYVWDKFLPDKRDIFYSMLLNEKDVENGDEDYVQSKYHLYTYNAYVFGYLSRMLFFRDTLKPLFEIWSHLIKFAKSLFLKDYRVLDKTPPNTFRVSYLKKIFPDAKFIYITRDAKTNIASLMEAWTSDAPKFAFKAREFYDYNDKINIDGYKGKVWKFTNPPGWEKFLDKSIEEVCAFQWHAAHRYAQESFMKMPAEDVVQVRYEDLISRPTELIPQLCDFINIEYKDAVKENTENLPMVSMVSKPNPNKWMKYKDRLEKIMPKISDMQKRLGYEEILKKEISSV